MIPWSEFEISSPYDLPENIPVPLQEHWLSWLPQGSTMMERFEESPMLEIAHERQFVICQIGGCSSGFEVEHTRRIGECLSALDLHFQRFATNELCLPTSPHTTDLCACWRPDTPLDSLPLFAIPADRAHETPPATPKQTQKLSPPPLTPTLARDLGTLVGPLQLDIGDEDNSDEMEEHFKQKLLYLPRARTTVSNNGSRSQKTIRLRRKFDSKLTSASAPSGTKRGRDWIADKHEDAATIAMRSQSIASLQTAYETHERESTAGRLPRREET